MDTRDNSSLERLLFTAYRHRSLSGGQEDDDYDEDHSTFGVHIEYEDLYDTIIFLVCVYLMGQFASRALKMPNLVGEIVAGILLGPPLADIVPNPEAWVLLGEIGLILLVVEAGIDIDVSTLKLIGTRGFLIAFIGSVLPIGIGIVLAIALQGTSNIKSSIAAGAVFGPTSLGIALNILRGGGVLNTPVGQLIISAAVIDDMIALIVLSQLESLTGTITVASILVPIVSAVGYLVIGGYIALYVVPGVMEKYILNRTKSEYHGKLEMAVMFGFLLALMPATYYSKASYLMGAFVAGLAFCTSHELHVTFVTQFKRILQWLMKVFFAASIGFQVPIKDFANGTVVWQGLVFTVALLGKLGVGFLVPNFTQSARFTGQHLRDCLITGFSMAAEGEFAFVIAVFSVDNGLIDKDLYASVVLAVLLSTIIPPFLLRFTISYYKKRAEEELRKLAESEMEKNHELEAETATSGASDTREDTLIGEIRSQRAVFFCIQTQSQAKWGLLHQMMASIGKLGLDIIDHRSWHPRGITTTLVNEIYCKDKIGIEKGKSQEVLEARIKEIQKKLEETINQPETSKVKVSRWFPGVVEEITTSIHENKRVRKSNLNLEERLLQEAAAKLDKKQTMQITATKEKTVEEILAGMKSDHTEAMPPAPLEEGQAAAPADAATGKPHPRARRRRQKMRSTPVVGGGLFGETGNDDEDERHEKKSQKKGSGVSDWKPDFNFGRSGHKAEIIVKGESYNVRISDQTLQALRTGFSGDTLDARGMSMSGIQIQPDSSNVVNQLAGYVRSRPLAQISEESAFGDSESETSSMHPGGNDHEHHEPHV